MVCRFSFLSLSLSFAFFCMQPVNKFIILSVCINFMAGLCVSKWESKEGKWLIIVIFVIFFSLSLSCSTQCYFSVFFLLLHFFMLFRKRIGLMANLSAWNNSLESEGDIKIEILPWNEKFSRSFAHNENERERGKFIYHLLANENGLKIICFIIFFFSYSTKWLQKQNEWMNEMNCLMPSKKKREKERERETKVDWLNVTVRWLIMMSARELN